MNKTVLRKLGRTVAAALLATAVAGPASHQASAAATVAKPNVSDPVTIADTGAAWTLSNGIVKIAVEKGSGKIYSCQYMGKEIIGHPEGWEQYPGGQKTARITIDPNSNNGDRGEVSVKGVDGHMDMEMRYTLERGNPGFYTYAIYTHHANYPTYGFPESRFIHEMIPDFDWLSVDADRNMPMCSGRDIEQGVVVHAKEQRILSTGLYKNSVEHKYNYCVEMYKAPAWGWSSIRDHIGIWFINPSNEFIGGGPTRIDLVCHMGDTILDYWTSGHYAGGAECNVMQGTEWTKVVGPIYNYFNRLDSAEEASDSDMQTFQATQGNPVVPKAWSDNANALYNDALAQAKITEGQWPYAWVQGCDYPLKAQRSTVTGKLVLNDPQATTTQLPNLWVGLAHPDYTGPGNAYEFRSGNGTRVTWDHDANYYQFWQQGALDGSFSLPNVRSGTYNLHAFANGVLGEFELDGVQVVEGRPLNLGNLQWKPVRYGQQVWDIGYPDRTGDKFNKGDGNDYWLWGWPLRYALLYPNDLTYTVGKSDYHKDWFFEEVPHALNLSFVNPDAKDPANQKFGWVKAESKAQYPSNDDPGPWRVYGKGRQTTWTVNFSMAKAVEGTATLRVSLAGADGLFGGNAGGLAIAVNGHPVGTINPVATNALRYNSDKGIWKQYMVPFDAGVLKWGNNQMTFTVPAGDVTTGVVWDYLRLELDQTKKFGQGGQAQVQVEPGAGVSTM